MKHGNISIFVPHNGCPHRCSFCNQNRITGVCSQPTPEDVDKAVRNSLMSGGDYDLEIEFFGGSFTAIDRDYMISLLECAFKHIKEGSVCGVRISTRPDAIDEEILDILWSYGVTAIELGAQSMCEDVLSANQRGHTAQDVRNASMLIKNYGFSLGLQMMTGLYASDDDKDIFMAESIIALSPDTVRVYPTVTLKNTMLEQLFESGEYQPPTLSESVNLCAKLIEMFEYNNIEVIRLGLHYSDELKSSMVFDNYHPAFKELCESKIMLDSFLKLCGEKRIPKEVSLTTVINPSSVSRFVGQKRANILKLKNLGYDVKIATDKSLSKYEIRIK